MPRSSHVPSFNRGNIESETRNNRSANIAAGIRNNRSAHGEVPIFNQHYQLGM